MSQSGYTPIQLYRTTTAAAAPTSGNLAAGELAINLTDEKLYFKNAAGTVKLLASNSGSAGSVTSVDVSGGTTGLTTSGGPITSSGTITLAGTLAVANGGTGATTLTSSYLLKGNGTSAVSASAVYDNGTNVGIGTATPGSKLDVSGPIRSTGTSAILTVSQRSTGTGDAWGMYSQSGELNFYDYTAAASRATISTAGYLEATYSDEVVALGNSGTATSIDLRQGNVFTATLTGNCTFTLTNPNANSNRGSSFTLILTNDATAGRTVAWAGGAFRFPGGAATLSRTTTANAVDIWVFFTPNNGTTWYGNISMKNMIA